MILLWQIFSLFVNEVVMMQALVIFDTIQECYIIGRHTDGMAGVVRGIHQYNYYRANRSLKLCSINEIRSVCQQVLVSILFYDSVQCAHYRFSHLHFNFTFISRPISPDCRAAIHNLAHFIDVHLLNLVITKQVMITCLLWMWSCCNTANRLYHHPTYLLHRHHHCCGHRPVRFPSSSSSSSSTTVSSDAATVNSSVVWHEWRHVVGY